MTRIATPPLDARDVDTIARDVRARIAAYVPGWRPTDAGAGDALVQVYARFLKTLADRIDQAPDKNALALFDLLGIELLPAQAARTPVVFTAMPSVGDSRVPERTRVGAKVEGRADPLVFETERAIALASANLTDVFTLWPGRDAYADHSADAVAGRAFTLFAALDPVPHALYLAHDQLLALTGKSTVEVRLELTTRGAGPVSLAWEYWDGVLWRAFKPFRPAATATAADSVDGSLGLTRSGIVRLVADCAESEPTAVAGVTARWIRARATEPVLYQPGREIAEVDRVGLRTVIDRTLSKSCDALADTDGIIADSAFAGETKLDLTKSVQPLGARPQLGSALYLGDEEILGKAGAEVTLCFRKVLTPEEKADQQGADLELDVAAAQKLVVDAAREEASALTALAMAMRTLVPASKLPVGLDLKIAAVSTASTAVQNQGINAIKDLHDAAHTLRSSSRRARRSSTRSRTAPPSCRRP